MDMMQMLSRFLSSGGSWGNPMQLLEIFKSSQINPQQIMSMFGNDPRMQQAQKMLQSGGNPQEIIKNVAQQKGIDLNQLQQIAQQFGIKL